MPRRDGTGPMGAGSMTGRGLGLCVEPGAARYGGGQGSGLGLACRHGFWGGRRDRCVVGQFDSAARKELLREQKNFLHQRLDDIEQELENL